MVSSQNDSDIRKQRSLRVIQSELRNMFANLLRVHRGAGKDYEIFHQVVDLAVKLCDHVKEFDNDLSPFDLARAVRIDEEPRGLTPEAREWEWGIERMRDGAAQIIASRLLGQGAQEAAGDRALFDGLSTIERMRAKNRQGY